VTLVCGADGCRAGWVALIKDLATGVISWRLCRTVADLAHGEPAPQIAAIDIPIGLPDRGARECDLQARKLLGRGRGSSVFPAPIRPVLDAASYEEACRIRFQEEGKKLSIQTWRIVPKIREVDDLLRQDLALQAVVREVHPEVSFFTLAGERSMQHSKKTRAGKEERKSLLEPVYGRWLATALAETRALRCSEDDVLDAFAALWTAGRIASGTSRSLPGTPPQDSFGLRMEIVA
jgi:predicted RNase H-like nuclease